MYLLGISCFYHDAAAALLKDGIIVAAAEEERFTRKKHDNSFPVNAITFCLANEKITIKDIDHICFYEKPLLKFDRLLSQHLEKFPFSYAQFNHALPSWITEKLRIPKIVKKKLGHPKDAFFIEHHMAHTASCFLVSPFKEAAICTVDGVGEWATTTLGHGKETDIKIFKELHFPHSLGLLYSTVTAHLGFTVNNAEYKVMGLAAYGKPTYYEELRKIIDIKDDGSYALNMRYFDYHYKLHMPSKKFVGLFGPQRNKNEPVEQQHKDLAASLQKITEEVLFKMLNHLYHETKTTNLCMAGGVALNSVANGKITKNTPFKKIFIQPAASDAGASIGAASYVYHTLLKFKRNFVMNHAYLGPSYTTEEIKKYLDENNIKYTRFKNEKETITATAQLIHNNKIIGWFQDRMEFGPRALGARSILSNPCNPQMKEILNQKVKHREEFRPFAPVITAENVHDWFDIDKDEEPFMLFVYPIKKEKRIIIPAVTHVDGTGRLQTITKQQNARYYSVIKAFEKLSGVPILINTSFNIRGEPIVCTPHDAYRCMMGTGIDCLVMGDFLIKRADNPKDMWDSEALAAD